MNRGYRQGGFTIIELTLSMAFVSILLIVIATTTVFLSNVYAKGTTLQLVNQSGREISDLLRRDLLQADQSNVQVYTGPQTGTAAWGRMCLGEYSYVWNTADGLNNSSAERVRVAGQTEPVRLLRVQDANRTLCTPNGAGVFTMHIPTNLAATDLLGDSTSARRNASRLAVHSLGVSELAVHSNQRLRRVELRLGTADTTAFQTVANGNRQCSLSGSNENDTYCAISTFTFFVRATNVK